MDDEQEKPSDEDVSTSAEPDEDTQMPSVEELRDELGEIGTRIRTAGLNPLRQMARLYVERTLDAVDGLLSALEGKRK